MTTTTHASGESVGAWCLKWLGRMVHWIITLFRAGGTSADRGFSDLLNYDRHVADGVIVLKDDRRQLTGPLFAGWWYRGQDFENLRSEELARISAGVNRALQRLDAGWMLHIEAVVSEQESYIPGEFANAIDRLLNDERRAASAHYVTRYALFLTQAPSVFDLGRAKQLRSVLLGMRDSGVRDELGERIAKFERVLSEVERGLSGVMQIERMRSTPQNDELLQALQLVVNGTFKRCRLPEGSVGIDHLLARDLIWSPDTMKHGDGYTAVVGLFRFPPDTIPGLMRALTSAGFPLRWSTRFIVLDEHLARARLTKLRRNWFQTVQPFFSKFFRRGGPINSDSLDRTKEVDAELKNLREGHVAYGHWTSVVVTRGRTQEEANERARAVIKVLDKAQFESRLEGLNRLEALLGSFPGHGRQNCRKPLMHTLHLADLMPIAREWEGNPTAPCSFYKAGSPPLGQVHSWSGGKFFFNLHVGQVGHTVVLGPTNAGKSTFLAWLATSFMRYWRSRVVVLDNGASMMALTLARRDGAFYPLAADENGLALCPLADIDDDADRAWAAEWLELLCEEHGLTLRPEQRNHLYEAVCDLANNAQTAHDRTLTDLLIHVNDTEVEAVLRFYTSGPGASVLNGTSNAFSTARFTTFEIEKLMALGSKVSIPTLMLIFRLIEKRLDGRPTLVIVDEAWLALGHPRWAERIKTWLKTWRRKNCAVVLATQSLSDVATSPVAPAVFESCMTRVLLPNHTADDAARALYREKLRLNEVQIATLCDNSDVQPARWYMYVAKNRSRLFSLNLGPVQRAFLSASGPEELPAIWELWRTYGAQWPAEWLRARGLREAASRYVTYLDSELQQEPVQGAA